MSLVRKVWKVSGRLNDGTPVSMLRRERPSEMIGVAEVQIDGVTWYVDHASECISEAMRSDLEAWVQHWSARLK